MLGFGVVTVFWMNCWGFWWGGFVLGSVVVGFDALGTFTGDGGSPSRCEIRSGSGLR